MPMLRAKDLRTISLPDGRRMEYSETGDPSGRPVFLFHGLPGGCLGAPAVPSRAGARVVVPGRPGYGHSDPLPKRRIADWPQDIAFMADALGILRFALIGFSMGGPYALACGSMMPGWVTALALVSAAGPPPMFGPRGWRSLSKGEVQTSKQPLAGMSRPADETLASRLEYLRSVGSNAFYQGASGVVGDLAAWRRPWGFDPAGVRAPVFIYHGEADSVVPSAVSQQRYQAIFPDAVARYWPGEGHRALWAHVEQVLANLFAESLS